MIRAGELNKRVELQAYITTEVDGFPTQDWSAFSSVRAQKIPVSQREYFAAAAVQQQNVIRWKIRWRKQYIDGTGKTIDWHDCRVSDLESSKSYDITGVDDGGGREYLIFITQEVTS